MPETYKWIKITLQSDLLVGIIESPLDLCCECNDNGIPCIPGEKIQNWMLRAVGQLGVEEWETVLSEMGENVCVIEDARPFYSDVLDHKLSQIKKQKADLGEYLTPQRIYQHYTTLMTAKKMDKRVYTIFRVIHQKDSATERDMTFLARIRYNEEFFSPEKLEILEKILKAVKNIKDKTNYGYGNVKIRFVQGNYQEWKNENLHFMYSDKIIQSVICEELLYSINIDYMVKHYNYVAFQLYGICTQIKNREKKNPLKQYIQLVQRVRGIEMDDWRSRLKNFMEENLGQCILWKQDLSDGEINGELMKKQKKIIYEKIMELQKWETQSEEYPLLINYFGQDQTEELIFERWFSYFQTILCACFEKR